VSTNRITDRTIIEHFPHPIAAAWRHTLAATNDVDRLKRLFFCYETTLRTLASIILLDYLQGPRTDRVDRLIENLETPSLGHWATLIRDSLTAIHSRDETGTFFPEALDWFFDQNGPKKSIIEVLETLVQLRNKDAHDTPAATKAASTEQCAIVFKKMRALCASLKWLRGYRLFCVHDLKKRRSSRTRYDGKFSFYVGTADVPIPVDGSIGLDLFEEAIYLAAPTGDRILEVTPFIRLEFDEMLKQDRLFLFRKVFKGKKLVLANVLSGTATRVLMDNEGDELPFNRWLSDADHKALSIVCSTSEPSLTSGFEDDRTGTDIDDEFRVLGKLGEGGMSVVYLVEDKFSQREVALKIMRDDLCNDSVFRKRFKREARTMRQLSHPNLVAVLSQGKLDDGSLWLMMPVFNGGTLSERLEISRIEKPQVLKWMAEMLGALVYLHGQEPYIVHRDIKPSNFLIDNNGAICLTDFGIARAENDSRLTRTIEQIGSTAFMSPEQRIGSDVGPPSDIFSLGIVFHEMITGENAVFEPGGGIDGPLGELVRAMTADHPSKRLAAQAAFAQVEALIKASVDDAKAERETNDVLESSWDNEGAETTGDAFPPETKKSAADEALDKSDLETQKEDEQPSQPIAATEPQEGEAGRTESALIRIIVFKDNKLIQARSYSKRSLLIGRTEIADIRLDSEAVSRQHARLEKVGHEWRVTDLGAANGLFLAKENGEPRQVRVEPIAADDRIVIGRYSIQTFDLSGNLGKGTARDLQSLGWENNLVTTDLVYAAPSSESTIEEVVPISFDRRIEKDEPFDSSDKGFKVDAHGSDEDLEDEVTGEFTANWNNEETGDSDAKEGSNEADSDDEDEESIIEVEDNYIIDAIDDKCDGLTSRMLKSGLADSTFNTEPRTEIPFGTVPFLKLGGGNKDLYRCQFSSDGTFLAASAFDGTARLWDTTSGQCVREFSGNKKETWTANFARNGNRISQQNWATVAKFCSLAEGYCLKVLDGRDKSIWCSDISQGGLYMATGRANGSAQVWDVDRGQSLHQLHLHTDGVISVQFSVSGQMLGTASYDHTVRLWDVKSGRCLHVLEGHSKSLNITKFSPDGSLVVSAGWNRFARLWDVATGDCVHLLKGHSSGIASAAFSPDGSLLATASYDETARLWDVSTGKCIRVLEGHNKSVTDVDFSADGILLATCSKDRSVLIWGTPGKRKSPQPDHLFRPIVAQQTVQHTQSKTTRTAPKPS
jgi:serine/threonine protein kinase